MSFVIFARAGAAAITRLLMATFLTTSIVGMSFAGTLEEALDQPMAGGVVVLKPGVYRASGLALKPNITLYAPNGATIVGDLVARGPRTTIRGLTFQGGGIDMSNSHSVTVGDCTFRGGTTAIKLDGATQATVINNDFRDVEGGAVMGWAVDRSTLSGNHFWDCGQCITLDFKNDSSRGRDIVIERNIFRQTRRMPLEIGPLDARTSNMIVRDNWATDFKNRGPDPNQSMSTFVAYSLVATRGVNTMITGNFASAGPNGRGTIGIELDGSGEISGNHIVDFDYGAVVYGAGFAVHGNTFVNTTIASVLDYSKRGGRIGSNTASAPHGTLRQPERRPWP